MQIKGGMLLENEDKIGVSNLLGKMLTKGTQNKTPEQLENAIESLGATINSYSTNEAIIISGNTLAKNYLETIKLVQEIILEPRWDTTEFDLLKQSTLNQIIQQKANPNNIAQNEFIKIIYGDKHILSNNRIGNETSVNAITIGDLKSYYNKNISPLIANFHVVGAILKADVVSSFISLDENWKAKEVTFPEIADSEAPEKSKIYFYDVPDAKQSVIRFGYPALTATDTDYYPATIMNYRLGGGGFASQLMQQLREEKGYTYGIISRFTGSNIKGPFSISSNIQTKITFEAVSLVKEILEQYGENYNENDLEVTKGYLIKSNARVFETMGSKLNMLSNISNYNFPYDYAKQRELIVKEMTVEEIKKLSEKYLDANKMNYLIVGDAQTQLEKLEQLGFGKPLILNR